ncbi:MAG: hypothetical protein VX949_11595 [Planctomycetota bacterium]|nr:hypothetical protein [Planctomycetota bacterium]
MSQSSAAQLTTPSRGVRILAMALGVLLTLSPVEVGFADIFHLKDGRVIDGAVLREIGDLISIRSSDGAVITIDRSEIVKTEKQLTPIDQYRTRLDQLDPSSLADQLSLARWCDSVNLTPQAMKHWKRVIQIDPDHDQARSVLGYVWIGGDWFLRGSDDAKKRRAELELDPATPAKVIPEELRLPEWERPDSGVIPELPPLPTLGVDRVVVTMDEKLGRSGPERSGMTYHLRRMGGKLQFVEGKDDGKVPVVLKIRIRCYFVRLETFYGAPIANIFQGEARAQFFERNSKGDMVLRKTTKMRIPFSSSAQRPKEQALQYTYYVTLETIAARISRWSWMKQRGSRSLPMPDSP